MNFTRWSARLPGTQRRAAARDDRSSVPSARAEYAQPETGPCPPDGDPGGDPQGGTDHDPLDDSCGAAPRPGGPALEDLSARDILGQLPALVALVYGPDHRIAYVNDAYAAAFGPRLTGATAAEAMPELDELSLLPLMDQVLRSGTPRTVKSRKARSGNSYTVTCTPVHRDRDDESEADDGNPPNKSDKNNKSTKGGRGSRNSRGRGGESGVLVYAADVTDHAEAAERLRASERRHRETAVTLQRSLLPQELEQPDDLRIAATYQPGGTDAAVGGDWYDVITLGAGRTALVIGDVMGRGVRAAAVMGQLRTAVRAYARLDLPPHEVLQLLDGLAAEIDASQIATCAYAVHDPNGRSSSTPPQATSRSWCATRTARSTAPRTRRARRSAPAAGSTPRAPSHCRPAPPRSSIRTAWWNAGARTSTRASPRWNAPSPGPRVHHRWSATG